MSQFTKVGVVGAGTMGSGIAQKIAQENIPVVIVDIDQKAIEKGLNNIRTLLQEGVEKKLFSPEKVEEILGRITGTTDLNLLKEVDLVIEAVFEDENVKRELFTQLDKICRPEAILASNTSSFKISELASSTKRPDRFIGLHYFYHPAKNRLLEIIPGKDTSPETIAKAEEFASLTGKTAIRVKDAPGFAVNRFFVPWLNEAVRIYEEGIANIPTIEEAAKRTFQIAMGPFLLMNLTGIPIAYHSAENLAKELGRFYTPAEKLKEQFLSGKQWDLSGEVDESRLEIVQKRLLGTVFLCVGELLQAQIASLEDIDRGAKIGLRWALGPFELMNSLGMNKSHEIMNTIAQKYSVSIPEVLLERFKSGRLWQFRYIDLVVSQNIATIIINRPEAMNALNETMFKQLNEVFSQAEKKGEVKAIVFEGKGKAFVAGADIGYFIKKIEDKRLEDIVEFTRQGQEFLLRIDRSSKLVIAKLDGLALGGGAELALACDVILMTERAGLGFPETGIGIYPGLGATQRLPRLIGKSLAKYLIFTGEILNGKQCQEIGLAEYVPVAEINKRIKEIVDAHPLPRREKTIAYSPEFQKIISIFSDELINELLTGKLLASQDPFVAKIAKKVSYKAPLAIKLANQIIDQGYKLNLQEGLELELTYLTEIFSTRDAYEGLTSVLEKRRPSFISK